MKKIISFIGIFLLLSSCSNSEDLEKISELESKNTELSNDIEELKSEIQDNTFEKNKECLLLNNIVNEYLLNSKNIGHHKDSIVEELFYSQERKSCLVSISYDKMECEGVDILSDLGKELKCGLRDKSLIDLFNKEVIVEQNSYTLYRESKCYEDNEDSANCYKWNNFNATLGELKTN